MQKLCRLLYCVLHLSFLFILVVCFFRVLSLTAMQWKTHANNRKSLISRYFKHNSIVIRNIHIALQQFSIFNCLAIFCCIFCTLNSFWTSFQWTDLVWENTYKVVQNKKKEVSNRFLREFSCALIYTSIHSFDTWKKTSIISHTQNVWYEINRWFRWFKIEINQMQLDLFALFA